MAAAGLCLRCKVVDIDGLSSGSEVYWNTMEPLQEQIVSCPYCGEAIEVLIDHQEAGDQYVEDCQVCCRPIVFSVAVDSMGNLSVTLRDENDAY